jgi:hypothetical protein
MREQKNGLLGFFLQRVASPFSYGEQGATAAPVALTDEVRMNEKSAGPLAGAF